MATLSQQFPHITLQPIENHVNRGADTRRQEAKQRPQNQFFLYKKLYWDKVREQFTRRSAKEYCKIIADSWNREKKEVHEAFKQYAQIERCNHYEVFPEIYNEAQQVDRCGTSSCEAKGSWHLPTTTESTAHVTYVDFTLFPNEGCLSEDWWFSELL